MLSNAIIRFFNSIPAQLAKENDVTRHKPKYSIRIFSKNLGFENVIKSVPLYSVSCISVYEKNAAKRGRWKHD